MGRIRTVKPDLFVHEALSELEEQHPTLRPMLAFIGLFTQCDRRGCFEWMPRKLGLAVLPFVESFSMPEAMALLEQHGYIRRYEVGGKAFGHIPTWRRHQRITGREATDPPRYPTPPGNTCESSDDSSGNIYGDRKDGSPKEKPGRKNRPKTEKAPVGFQLPPEMEAWFEAIWWDLYPEQVEREGEPLKVDRGLKNKARERFAAWCKKTSPLALYLSFRAYIKNHPKVKEGYVQELATFLGPKKATVKDYLEQVLPWLDRHPTIAAMTAPPENEEAFQALLAKEKEAHG